MHNTESLTAPASFVTVGDVVDGQRVVTIYRAVVSRTFVHEDGTMRSVLNRSLVTITG